MKRVMVFLGFVVAVGALMGGLLTARGYARPAETISGAGLRADPWCLRVLDSSSGCERCQPLQMRND